MSGKDSGDRLARGNATATFETPHVSQEKFDAAFKTLRKKKLKDPFACKDCDAEFATSAEFSDHIRVCPVNPVKVKARKPAQAV